MQKHLDRSGTIRGYPRNYSKGGVFFKDIRIGSTSRETMAITNGNHWMTIGLNMNIRFGVS